MLVAPEASMATQNPYESDGSACVDSCARRIACLLRWTRNGPIGTKHAAVAILRPQPHAASFALVKELTSVYRHLFAFREAAMRTGDDGMERDIIHSTCAAALRLEPRRQLRQPLRRGVDEHGFQPFVETDHYQYPEDDKKQPEPGLGRLADR